MVTINEGVLLNYVLNEKGMRVEIYELTNRKVWTLTRKVLNL